MFADSFMRRARVAALMPPATPPMMTIRNSILVPMRAKFAHFGFARTPFQPTMRPGSDFAWTSSRHENGRFRAVTPSKSETGPYLMIFASSRAMSSATDKTRMLAMAAYLATRISTIGPSMPEVASSSESIG